MVPLRPEDLANGTAQEPESNRNMSVAWSCFRNSESYMLIQCYTICDHKANINVSIVLNSPSQSQQLTEAIFLKRLSCFKSVPLTNSYSGMYTKFASKCFLFTNVLRYSKFHIKHEARKLPLFLVETKGPLNSFQMQLIKHHPVFLFKVPKRIESGIFPGQWDQTLARGTGPQGTAVHGRS